jgi:hypothetical protein
MLRTGCTSGSSECETRGLLVAAGTEWFPPEPSGPFLRLEVAGRGPGRFVEAGDVLGQVLTTSA